MKVRVNSTYRYNAGYFMDRTDARVNAYLKVGDLVKVVNLPGCPPANTMGQCYVNLVGSNDRSFVMVSTLSLEKV